MLSLEQASPMELRLTCELQAAYQQQLVEQEQSARNFLSKVACLCEREDCSSAAIASVLRGLSNTERGGASIPWHAGNKGSETCVKQTIIKETIKETCIKETMESDCAQLYQAPNKDSADNGQVSMDQSDEKRPKKIVKKSYSTTFQDVEDKDMEVMKREFDVKQCSFIERDGKINHRPSDFEAIMGPFLRHFYERLTAPWLQPMRGRFLAFVQSPPFKTVGTLVILANFFFIIIQSDYRIWAEINESLKKEAHWMKIAEVAFTFYYCFEVTCLIIAYRKDFFLGDDMSWNWFDFIIVLTGALELVLTSLGGRGVNLSFLRVLRFFKMTRVLRMFCALRMVKDVKVMVDALTGSFVIFVFGCILWGMCLSVFSIFFVQGITTFLEESDVDPSLRDSIIADWGSVATAMRSLFMSATGGDDWSKFHDTLKAIGPAYDYLYLFFIAFTLSAFFNVITGVFAEKAMSLAAPTLEELAARRLDGEVKDAEELVGLLDRILKKDGTGAISIDAFDDLMSHPQVEAFFEVRGLKATTAHRFFIQMLDINQTDRIDIGAFVSACVKLDGTASSIDLHVLSVEVQTLLMQQHMLQHSLTKSFAGMAKQLSEFRNAASNGLLPMSPCSPSDIIPMINFNAASPLALEPPVLKERFVQPLLGLPELDTAIGFSVDEHPRTKTAEEEGTSLASTNPGSNESARSRGVCESAKLFEL